MAFLNLIIGAVLFALGSLFPDGSGDGSGSTGTATPPATGDNGSGSTGGAQQSTTTSTTTSTTPQQPSGDAANGGADADDDGGRGSKSAVLADLARERDKRQTLETEIAELRAFRDQHKSDAEKQVDQAVKAARDEESARWSNGARASAWRAALTKLGCADADAVAIPSDVLKLKVDPETFGVEGIDKAATDFQKEHPNLFGVTSAGGSADQGPRGSAPRKPATLEEAVNRQLAGQGARTS